MAIIVEQKSGFEPMPDGFHEAVFSEIKDLGEKPDQFNPGKMKRTIAARLTNAKGQEATRFYTPSLHEKSTLAKDLIAIKGAIPSKLDLEKLLGVQCRVLVTAGTNVKGQATAKIEKILKPNVGQQVPTKTFPKRDAAPAAGRATSSAAAEAALAITDDDIPF